MCQTLTEPVSHEPPMVRVVEKPPANSANSNKKLKFICQILILSFIFIICTTIVVALGYDIQRKQNKPRNKTLTLPVVQTTAVKSDEDEKSVVRIISRNEWKSLPENENIPILKPEIKYVILCHTGGRFCNNFNKCSAIVRWIQSNSIRNKKLADIVYNFIVGGDGNIYVGRGWKMNNFMNNTIQIAFTGNYVYDVLTEEMIINLKNFLKNAVETKKLDQNYLLVPHNQTMNTQSPGPNIFKVIKKWSQYSPDIISN